MPRLWLVTLLTSTLLLLLHTPTTNTASILTSSLNITDENATTTSTADSESSEGNLTLPSDYPKVQNDPRLLAKALDLKDWLTDDEDEGKPTPVGKRAIPTSTIIKNTTKVATTASTTVPTTTIPSTTVPTTTVSTNTITTATTPTTTIATTTTLNIEVFAVDAESTELVPVGSPDDEANIVFSDQESPDLDTQIATGGSEDNDAPEIHEVELTPAPNLIEIIDTGLRNADDEDYVGESSATHSPSSESHEDANLDDDESFEHNPHVVHESSASNRNIPYGSEVKDHDDGRMLPHTNDTDDFVDKPYNVSGDLYPQTLSDQFNTFVHEFSQNHPGVAYVLVCTLLAIIVMLIFLAVRECCKSRLRHRSRTPPSVTADLYNTSACSHFYQKPTLLPNQHEVTMQLVSSDIAEDMV